MTSCRTIVFVTLTPAEAGNVFAQFPWKVCSSESDPCVMAQQALSVNRQGVVVFCKPESTLAGTQFWVEPILHTWPDAEVVIVSANSREVSVKAVKAGIFRTIPRDQAER